MFSLGLCGCLQCLWVIVVGGAAGFLAGQLIRGRGYNPVANVALGMGGFLVGSLLFGTLGRYGVCGTIIVSVLGAVVLVLGVRLVFDRDFAR